MSSPAPRFITPAGFARIRAEYEELFGTERPKIVETISWAAANGDRSENGDYIYGRKRLREIDRRLGYLAKVMKTAKVVDPAAQECPRPGPLRCDNRACRRGRQPADITLVGDDEADASNGRIGWSAPLARAFVGAGSATSASCGCRPARKATRCSRSATPTT